MKLNTGRENLFDISILYLQLQVILIKLLAATARGSVMQQAYGRQRHQDTASSLTDGENVAIWALRRVVGGDRHCQSAGIVNPTTIERELAGIADIFRDLFKQQPETSRIRPVRLGASGCLVLTKDERRLLNVIAAVQAGEDELLDNYLYRLSLECAPRSRLAEAVTKLAACLAVHGYWLPRSLGAVPVPAAALAVVRVHGRDLRDVRVAWP